MREIPRQTPTMYDVATCAGVSHQTVSRVLNDFSGIRPDTRARVLRAIAELGYRRNVAARTLATKRTRAIGVLASDVSDYGPTRAVQVIEASARAAGYHPLVTTAESNRDSVRASLDFLLDQSVEALVVIAPQQLVLEVLDELQVSLPIAILQSAELGRGAVVSVDQLAGAKAAMDHLLELGHRRIQHLTGPLHYLEARARRDAYLTSMKLAGLKSLELLLGDWTADSGFRAAARVDPTATAVFVSNDQMALGLMRGLVERDRRVPESVSVVGFDDVAESRFYSPPLTTVRQDFERVGDEAVAALVAQIEHDVEQRGVSIAPQLIIRSSTARP